MPLTNKKKNFWTRLGEAVSPAIAAKLNQKQIAERIEQLSRRVDVIQGELNSMSLSSARLDTQGLIELYYNAYNPDVFEEQKLANLQEIHVE